MQRQHQPGCLERQRRMAEILGAELGETELFLAGHFPQKFEIDVGGDRLGLLEQFGRGRPFVLQQHVPDLDLGAFATWHVHLVGLAGMRQHRADLEIAGFFKK